MKVKDIMTPDVISCDLYTPIHEVARILAQKGISAVVVLDESGELAGIVSQTDLVNIRVHEDYWEHWRGLSAKHIMTKEVVTIDPESTIEEAARLMRNTGVHRLVVVERRGGSLFPAGILSMTDIVREMAKGE